MRVKATHCRWGHPYDEENTGVNKTRGERYCRTCHRLWQRKCKDPGCFVWGRCRERFGLRHRSFA